MLGFPSRHVVGQNQMPQKKQAAILIFKTRGLMACNKWIYRLNSTFHSTKVTFENRVKRFVKKIHAFPTFLLQPSLLIQQTESHGSID